MLKNKQHILPSSQERLCSFKEDCVKIHSLCVTTTTTWIHSTRVQILFWPACSQDLLRKHLAHYEIKNTMKGLLNSWFSHYPPKQKVYYKEKR